MRVGSRWGAGERPHPSVPAELFQAISEAEGARPEASSWTLTWLEGLPQCSLEGALLVRLTAKGEVRTEALDDDDHHRLTGGNGTSPTDSDDDDDDWLS